MNEIIFLEAQIKILIQTIRVTKDVDSIRALRTITRETIERMETCLLRLMAREFPLQ